MDISAQLARHLRELYFGGNWTAVNMKEVLSDVNWKQATTKVGSLNTIAVLLNHTGYYIRAVSKVLEGEPLHAKDADSFEHPPLLSEEDWQQMLENTWKDVSRFAELIEKIPPGKFEETFHDEKYGSYYRNMQGIIEHTHYHLGQMVLLKKMLPA